MVRRCPRTRRSVSRPSCSMGIAPLPSAGYWPRGASLCTERAPPSRQRRRRQGRTLGPHRQRTVPSRPSRRGPRSHRPRSILPLLLLRVFDQAAPAEGRTRLALAPPWFVRWASTLLPGEAAHQRRRAPALNSILSTTRRPLRSPTDLFEPILSRGQAPRPSAGRLRCVRRTVVGVAPALPPMQQTSQPTRSMPPGSPRAR